MKNNEVKNIWNANAKFWDKRMGEGNDFHKTLIEPTQLKLLKIKSGDKILDIACGNGQFARKMAELGANVTATDFAEKFIQIAKAKGPKSIKYLVIDATKTADLKKLSGTTYDSIVCTMALMDMEKIEPLIKYLPKLLKKDGEFVFSITHPCFNGRVSILVKERDDLDGEVKNKYYVKVGDYLKEGSTLGVGMAGQPKPQRYFHRSVTTILRCFFENGFILDAYEEPSFANLENNTSLFGNVYKHIPPALVCRLKMK